VLSASGFFLNHVAEKDSNQHFPLIIIPLEILLLFSNNQFLLLFLIMIYL